METDSALACHVFYVHSHLTAAVARGVMRHLNLPAAACVVLFDRNARSEMPAGARVADVPPLQFPLKVTPWELWRRIRAFDEVVRQVTAGQPFHLYCPHLNLDPVRLLYTNPQCRAVSYLEEGMMSYNATPPFEPRLRYSLLRRLLSGGRLPHLPPFPADVHARAYGLHEAVFPGLPRRVLLPYPFDSVRHRVAEPLDGAHILVFDALLEMNVVAPPSFEAGMRALVSWWRAEGVKRVHFKYHPVQFRDPSRQQYYTDLLARLAPEIAFVTLPADLVLEDLAGSFQDLTFYIAVSSVGLYAVMAGQRVVSIAQILARTEPTFANLIRNVFEPHGDQITFL